MLPALKKPDDYRVLVGDERTRVAELYHEFQFRLQQSTQQSYSRLYEVQRLPTPRGLTKREAERNAMQPMWDCYDIYSRAVLYLSVRAGRAFDRKTLKLAQTHTHSFTDEEIDQYDWDFPKSMFNHHCDLSLSAGEKYKFKYQAPVISKIEVVVEGFAFYVVSNQRFRTYVTLWNGSLKLLETGDYDDDLNRDWDGRCRYIQ